MFIWKINNKKEVKFMAGNKMGTYKKNVTYSIKDFFSFPQLWKQTKGFEFG